MKYIFSFILASSFFCAVYAKTAASIEYKIDNPDSSFTAEDGRNYAKLMGIAATALKNIEIYNPIQLEKDLGGIGIYPQKRITGEDLSTLCNTRYIDMVICGKLFRISKGFRSESVLYSSSTKSVIARSTSTASSLNELAGKDARNLLSAIRDKPAKSQSRVRQIAVLFDNSYNMSPEMDEAKSALKDFSLQIFSDFPGSTVHIIPYNSKQPPQKLDQPAATLISAESLLSKIKPAGANNEASFSYALNFAVENVVWNPTAVKSILVVSNSPFTDSLNASRYARRAANKKIRINAIILGKTPPSSSVNYSRICDMTGGFSADVSYRQTMYDTKGDDFYLYLERGRLFEGLAETDEWQNGIFRYPEKKRFGYAKSPDFAEELFPPRGYTLSPYSLEDFYRKNGQRGFVRIKPIESNIRKSAALFAAKYFQDSGASRGTKLARVLVSQGGVSVWTDIYDKESLDFFTGKKTLGYSLPLGIIIKPDKNEPYGFTFDSSSYITSLSGDYIPDSIRTSLAEIAKNPKKFMEGGLLRPSIWFIEVKVEDIRLIESADDIRGG